VAKVRFFEVMFDNFSLLMPTGYAMHQQV